MNQYADKNVGTYLDRTLKIVKQHYLKVFKAEGADISTEQWVIIDQLRGQDGMSQTDLASGSYKNAPTVSRIIDLLVKKGLVERQRFPNDRRRYKIFLTAAGRKLHEELLPKVVELRARSWHGLNEADWVEFKRMIDTVQSNFTEGEDED